MTDDWFKVTYPLCTIATTPRLPEHCIEYVKVIQWDKQNPWGVSIDGDDPAHINWIYERAAERAAKFNIEGVTYRLVQASKVFEELFLFAKEQVVPPNDTVARKREGNTKV